MRVRVEYFLQFSGRRGQDPRKGRSLRDEPEVCSAELLSGALCQGLEVVCIIIWAPAVHPSVPSCEVLRTARNVAGIPIPVFGNTSRGTRLLPCPFPYDGFPPLAQ